MSVIKTLQEIKAGDNSHDEEVFILAIDIAIDAVNENERLREENATMRKFIKEKLFEIYIGSGLRE